MCDRRLFVLACVSTRTESRGGEAGRRPRSRRRWKNTRAQSHRVSRRQSRPSEFCATGLHPLIASVPNMGVRSEIAEHNVDFEGVAAAIKFAAFKKKTVKLSQEDLSKTSPPPKTKR